MLLVDDDAAMCEMVELDLRNRGFAVEWCTTAAEALQRAAATPWDAVVTDLNLRGSSGLDVCRELVARDPTLPVVIITGFGSIESAVQAIRLGAYDFITKPFEFETLALTLERAVAHRALQLEVSRLRREVADNPPRFAELLGTSPPMQELFRMLHRVADTMTTVLVTGESGVGKELVARALHQESRRRAGPFVAINCGALPENLLESELFGHVKGAFTDARADRAGVFREANGGTLFLDEVGELPISLQPKLLRVLQERVVRPLGASREVPVDVRIVCATNVDLREAVEQGKFREDLYYRLDVVHLEVPPLRARGTDVLLLAEAFLERLGKRDGRLAPKLPPEIAARLMAYEWPGNVRELLNLLERVMALSNGDTIREEDLPDRVRRGGPAVIPDAAEPATILPLAEVEKRYILKVLGLLKGNKRKAAEALGLDRSTLYRKLQTYGDTSGENGSTP
ncbi:MAG: sigma-54-dependent transcriptional regulator [Myxococcota bacterium]